MQQRLDYLDTIRLVAMTMMVVCHACDPFNAGATYGNGEVNVDMFLWGSIWGSGVRACVPLFIMLTGALCLGTQMEMQAFWRRRIGRVLWPFLIWSVVYNMFPWFIGVIGQPESRVYDFFVWASNPSSDLGVCLSRVVQVPFRFDNLACHMWYVYTLIGLYLFIPILSAWVRTATRRQMKLVLCLWLASTCLPYMHEYVGRYLFGECEWNAFGLFYYFSGFTGYLLLGYYLTMHNEASPADTPRSQLRITHYALCIILFLLGFAITWLGFRHITAQESATPEQMELFWTYCSPNVVMMTAAVFMLVRRIPTGGTVARALRNFTVCGFGIYMIHYFFIGPTYSLVESWHLPTAVRVPVAALLVLAASWALVAIVKHYYRGSKWLLG